MNNFVPWFVAAATSFFTGSVLWSYATWLPVRTFDVFLMIGMCVASAVIIRSYFQIYAIFDRMGRR